MTFFENAVLLTSRGADCALCLLDEGLGTEQVTGETLSKIGFPFREPPIRGRELSSPGPHAHHLLAPIRPNEFIRFVTQQKIHPIHSLEASFLQQQGYMDLAGREIVILLAIGWPVPLKPASRLESKVIADMVAAASHRAEVNTAAP